MERRHYHEFHRSKKTNHKWKHQPRYTDLIFIHSSYKHSADEATESFQSFTVMQLSLPFFQNMSPCHWVTGATPQKNGKLKPEELQNAMY